MLTRAVILAATVALQLAGLPSASAGTHRPIKVGGDSEGSIGTTVTSPGHGSQPTHAGQPGTSGATSGPTQECPWVEVFLYQAEPLPRSVNGKKGTWWEPYCNESPDGAGFVGSPVFVPKGTRRGTVLTVSPAVLAQRAVSLLHLPRPSVDRDPKGQGLVNLPEWFWVDPAQWVGLTQRTQAGAVWAVVTATPVSTSWSPGDGSSAVECPGPGTPYDPSAAASAQTTDCSHTYTTSSADQPQAGPSPNDRFFTVTVTTSWDVTWVGSGGATGTLPVMTRSTSFPLAVAQRETVVTAGSG